MSERIEEAWSNEIGLAFDGRVVELFGTSEAERVHVRQFGYEVKDYGKQGKKHLRTGLLRKGKLRGGAMFVVEAADWPAMQQVLSAIDEAQGRLGA